MLFGYEMKKIWRRVSPLLVLIVFALTAVATIALTMILDHYVFQKNHDTNQSQDVSVAYKNLEDKIDNWNTTFNRTLFAKSFESFYNKYSIMNASTEYGSHNLVGNYQTAKDAFNDFYVNYYQHYIVLNHQNATDYLLIRSKYVTEFIDILNCLDEFFLNDYNNNNDIINGLRYTNPKWEDESLQTILENLIYVQKITTEDIAELKQIFQNYPSNQPNYDYTDAYDYAINRFWLAIAKSSKYSGELSQYEGFSDYQDELTSIKACKLATYRLEHDSEDFATPFEFGNIYNNSDQISLLDFVFNNLEMAMIPIALMVMIWAACAFFTDNNQNTLIAPVVAGKKRSTIIFAKTTVILLLTVAALLVLTGIYVISGLLFFHAYLSPDILFLFNGTQPMVMSAINYFVLYFLNLVFKLLPLIALCGLFSFIKNKPFIIVGLTTIITAAMILTNALLGSFDFYQYVPLMGLDPIRYFGANLLFAPMPDTYNLWYTFPVVAAITGLMYWALIHIFRHHDF